mgnify:CR=1 FL=1
MVMRVACDVPSKRTSFKETAAGACITQVRSGNHNVAVVNALGGKVVKNGPIEMVEFPGGITGSTIRTTSPTAVSVRWAS